MNDNHSNRLSCILSANPHPSPTPACAQFQPLTLKTGPNWPKYAPFTFSTGLRTYLGEHIFRFFWPKKWGVAPGEDPLGIAIQAIQPKMQPVFGFDAEPARLRPKHTHTGGRGCTAPTACRVRPIGRRASRTWTRVPHTGSGAVWR